MRIRIDAKSSAARGWFIAFLPIGLVEFFCDALWPTAPARCGFPA